MKRILSYGAMLCALALFAGCGETPTADGGNADGGDADGKGAHVAHGHACVKCGFVEIDGKCKCGVEGVSTTACKKCSVPHGSALCCNERFATAFEADPDHIEICLKCGHVMIEVDGKDTCLCKAENPDFCEGCKTHKGSPYCLTKCGKPASGEPVPAPNPKDKKKKTDTGS